MMPPPYIIYNTKQVSTQPNCIFHKSYQVRRAHFVLERAGGLALLNLKVKHSPTPGQDGFYLFKAVVNMLILCASFFFFSQTAPPTFSPPPHICFTIAFSPHLQPMTVFPCRFVAFQTYRLDDRKHACLHYFDRFKHQYSQQKVPREATYLYKLTSLSLKKVRPLNCS